MELMFELSLGFENVAIKQKKNKVTSRSNVNISSEIIRGVNVEVPLIASNMQSVVNSDFYIKLHKLGAFAILHRALKEHEYISEVKKVTEQCQWVAVSIGVSEDQYDLASKLIKNGANIIVIDIAHGYSDSVIQLGRIIKQHYPHIKMVVGNTTNVSMLEEVADFADGIKVGLSNGFACETKNTAGCIEKQFSAVYKFHELSRKYDIPVISDGGIREPADFVKSIAACANSVMAGKIFAACPESAAPEVMDVNGSMKKCYQGMASRSTQEEWLGKLKNGCPEGTVRYLEIGEPVKNLIERYSGALRSGISYGGGKDIESFQSNVEFVRLA
jgi:IMP dehydrogenase